MISNIRSAIGAEPGAPAGGDDQDLAVSRILRDGLASKQSFLGNQATAARTI